MATRVKATWQEELLAVCREKNLTVPQYNLVSDRRGGRTAWSATVTVARDNVAARYWYDGQYINNAKEDAAEVMLTRIKNPAITQTTNQVANQFRAHPQFGAGGYGR